MAERALPIISALYWSIFLGALSGGISLTIWMVVAGEAYGIVDNVWLAPIAPFMFAGMSLIWVIPCTLVFGIPSALLIKRSCPTNLPVLAYVC